MDDWVLSYTGYQPEHEGLREALCTLGNGYVATRGAAPDCGADAIHYPGTYLAGGYNRLTTTIAGRDVENEDLVNLPNWLPLTVRIDDGEWLRLDTVELLAYRHFVDPNALDELPDFFISADSIAPESHVEMQACVQKWVDSSISKTVNVAHDFPYQRFKSLYLKAADAGLKGCTTFRFNPQAFQGVLVKESDLAKTTYRFELEDGSVVEVKGNEEVEYEGAVHTAANLFDALKEGTYRS